MDTKVQATATTAATNVYGYGSAKALPIAAVQPGTGRVLALAVNRHYSLAKNPGGKDYPNTVDQLVAGGNSVTGYQAGSTFKLFTMLAALESGLHARYRLQRSRPAANPVVRQRAGVMRRRLLPGQRQSIVDGRLPDDVDRIRPLGQHLLRLAGGARRRGQGGRDGPATRHHLPRQVRRRPGRRPTPPTGARSPSVSPTPRRWTWPTPTPPSPPTAPTARRCRSRASATRAEKPLRRPTRAATGWWTRTSPGPRSTPRAARSASRRVRPVRRWHRRAGVRNARWPAGGRQDRQLRGATRPSRSSGFTPQAAAAGIAANPAHPADGVGAAVQVQVISAVTDVLKRALVGQPEKGFTAPTQSLAFGNGWSPAVTSGHD